MAGRDDEERIRRAREQADRVRRRASSGREGAPPPGHPARALPDGWSRVRMTAAQRRAVRVDQVLVGPGGVVVVADAPASFAAHPGLRHEPVTTCTAADVGATLVGLPTVLDTAHVEATRVRVEAAVRSLDTGFADHRDSAAAQSAGDTRPRVPAVVAVVLVVVLVALMALAASGLADRVGEVTG
jgi:hypothetical protein